MIIIIILMDRETGRTSTQILRFSVKSVIKLNTEIDTGARKGPTEKSGVSPARSRRCKGERTSQMSLKPTGFGKAKRAMNPSQKNCLYGTHFLTRERRGGDDCTAVLCWQLPSNRLFDNEKAFFNVVYITAWTTVI